MLGLDPIPIFEGGSEKWRLVFALRSMRLMGVSNSRLLIVIPQLLTVLLRYTLDIDTVYRGSWMADGVCGVCVWSGRWMH